LYYTRASNKNFSWKSIDQFFYPLDKILHWNRMYGTGGFTQYQLVLPKEASLPGLVEILKRISRTKPGAFLGVLKLFGKENDNLLSFPLEGYTLAVDFKINRDLFPFLDELDQIVLDFGGRLYLSKDVRMNQVTFRRGYPRWENFANLRERHSMRKFKSLQSERIGL
jgi:FAD/FMN-containing dehydrogenase